MSDFDGYTNNFNYLNTNSNIAEEDPFRLGGGGGNNSPIPISNIGQGGEGGIARNHADSGGNFNSLNSAYSNYLCNYSNNGQGHSQHLQQLPHHGQQQYRHHGHSAHDDRLQNDPDYTAGMYNRNQHAGLPRTTQEDNGHSNPFNFPNNDSNAASAAIGVPANSTINISNASSIASNVSDKYDPTGLHQQFRNVPLRYNLQHASYPNNGNGNAHVAATPNPHDLYSQSAKQQHLNLLNSSHAATRQQHDPQQRQDLFQDFNRTLNANNINPFGDEYAGDQSDASLTQALIGAHLDNVNGDMNVQESRQQRSTAVSRSNHHSQNCDMPMNMSANMSSVDHLSQMQAEMEQPHLEHLQPFQQPPEPQKDILASFELKITSLSVEPLSAFDILAKVKIRSKEVSTKYLPCVEFLVMCQQELRTGLEVAMARRGRGQYMMNTTQFYSTYFGNLPRRFYSRNKAVMPIEELNAAYHALQALLEDVKKMRSMNKHEGMKNSFLGGMRDGESWGLRKWLSKHGGALSICNDVELIWGGLRVLDKSDPKIIEIAKRIRPKMKNALDRLKMDVPKAYQEVSSAHPYLPFFHRLESVLKGMSEFDPEDDDVICLDDSDDEDAIKPAVKSTNSSAARATEISSFKTLCHDDEDDDDSEIEVVRVTAGTVATLKQKEDHVLCGSPIDFGLGSNQPTWRCSLCTFQNTESQTVCVMCDSEKVTDTVEPEATNNGITFANLQVDVANNQELAEAIESIANSLEEGVETRPSSCINVSDFWSHPSSNYVFVLRLFRDLVLSNASRYMLDPISIDEELTRYYSLIKNPLGFRDIVKALVEFDQSEGSGKLPNKNLRKWNMFEGKWLIQGMDLVMLNSLAFLGKNTNPLRKQIMGMRKLFWKSIREAGCPDKKQMPTRRTENSDFLLHRNKK